MRRSPPCSPDAMLAFVPAPTGINTLSLTVIRILALIAASIAAYLTWVTLTHGTLAACGDESSNLACDDVLRSPWSRVVGVPVSLLGLATYAAILSTSGWLVSASRQRFAAWMQLSCLTLIVIAFGAAVWFLFLQLLVIGHVCLFCLTIHVCGIIVAVILLTSTAIEAARRRRPSPLLAIQQLTVGKVSAPAALPSALPLFRVYHWCAPLALVPLLTMILLQVFFPAKTYELVEPEGMSANVSVEGAEHRAKVDSPSDVPMDVPVDEPSVKERGAP